MPLFGIVTQETPFAQIIALTTVAPWLALKHELSIYYIQNCDNNKLPILEANLENASFLLSLSCPQFRGLSERREGPVKPAPGALQRGADEDMQSLTVLLKACSSTLEMGGSGEA